MTRVRFRVVLDTNVLISSQLSNSEDSPNKEIIQTWHDDQFDFLWTEDILNEYIDKLKYFGIHQDFIVKIISQFIAIGEEVKIRFFHYELYPKDAKDICFALCALNGNGSHIITYDTHLLDLKEDYRNKFGIEVVKPIEFLKLL